MLLRFLLALALAIVFAPPARADDALVPAEVLPAVVERLDVDGTWRTEAFVVTRELPWKKGDSVTAEAWELGVQRLWNLGIFSRVDASLVREDGHLVAKVKVEERWTINLIARFGVGGGVGWWAAGLTDINTLGRFIESGAYYQRFGDLNCGQAWLRFPRFLDQRQDLYLIGERIGRPRADYVQLRTSARAEYFRQLTERLAIGGRLEFAVDRFDQVPSDPPFRLDRERFPVTGGAAPEVDKFRPVPPKPLPTTDSETGFVGGIVRLGRVDIQRLFEIGESLELRPSLALTSDPKVGLYAQIFAEGLFYRVFANRLNLAIRGQAGYLTDAPYQSAYFIGGLDLVRGLLDGAIRTRLFALANVEARVVAFDSMWLAVVPAVFTDGVVARLDDGRARGVTSVGGGIRFLIPRFVHSGLRFDYAVVFPGARFDWRRPSIGVWQFF